MSLPPNIHRKASDAGHVNKTHSDKNKHMSGHAETKNGTHGKTEISGHKNTLRKSKSVDHTSAHSKLDGKKHTSVNTRAKTTRAAEDAHTNATSKSRGVPANHGSHPHTKAQAHTDGKKTKHDRSDSHGKSGTHSTAKKSDGQKSQTNKSNKTKHEKSDREKDGNTGTIIECSVECNLMYYTIL
ncbi:unnamed protein product [Rotaria sp. Silwood1]|nr:unnamed protein product [Rotaria sp. Silwood1]CAF3329788.1 unnamed protein product [Rotaria sp. Silwood1]CAF3353184.1 unnamed protein product [Rotaria sp. Silwood1]CAF3358079.1 unnamed protein product [Rotaria sp. Silwood1]CAF4541280.1 unnamed protein product [Rotaria sp. Silwood1]